MSDRHFIKEIFKLRFCGVIYIQVQVSSDRVLVPLSLIM